MYCEICFMEQLFWQLLAGSFGLKLRTADEIIELRSSPWHQVGWWQGSSSAQKTSNQASLIKPFLPFSSS